jgi:hypothetical protein
MAKWRFRVNDIISPSESRAELSLYPTGDRGNRAVERVEFASRHGDEVNR